MALEDAAVLDMIKSIARLEAKVDMLMGKEMGEKEEEDKPRPIIDKMNPMEYSNQLEFDITKCM